MKKAIKEALIKLQAEGFNIDNADIKQLKRDVKEEYEDGADGSVYDVIMDLNDTVGLEVYNIS